MLSPSRQRVPLSHSWDQSRKSQYQKTMMKTKLWVVRDFLHDNEIGRWRTICSRLALSYTFGLVRIRLASRERHCDVVYFAFNAWTN